MDSVIYYFTGTGNSLKVAKDNASIECIGVQNILCSIKKERFFMKFCWSTIMVKNMDESLKFYQEIVGLNIDRRFQAGPGMEITFLGDGETKVELIHDSKLEEISLGKDISLGFQVNSLDEMMTFVKERGLEIHSGPFQPNPSIKYFYILDPNGLKIQIVENINHENISI